MQLVKKKEGVVPVNQIGEASYRALKDRLSYSAHKLYIQSRSRFLKEIVLGEYKPKEGTVATILGDMVHVLLADQIGEWDSKFILTSTKPPTGQVLELTNELYKRSLQSMDEEGIQKDEFKLMFDDAVRMTKFEYDGITEKAFKGKTPEKILELFQATGEKYYQELLNSTGKTVVTISQIEQAEKLVNTLKEHPYTRDIINLQSSGDIQVFNELIILYEIDNILYRSMVDKLVINHDTKEIQVWDYKTSYNVETQWEYSYLSNGYYIQVGLYQIAVEKWAIEHDLGDYKICPMRYIAIDTTGQSSPVIYTLTEKDVLMGQRGFTIRGKHYTGCLSIHQQIQWNLATGNWTTNQEIAENNGVMQMKLVYR